MPKQFEIKSLTGIDWNEHYDHDNEIDFTEFLDAEQIVIGNLVKVENKQECPLPLDVNQYCVTFRTPDLFIEEPFTLNECKELFGKDFDY